MCTDLYYSSVHSTSSYIFIAYVADAVATSVKPNQGILKAFLFTHKLYIRAAKTAPRRKKLSPWRVQNRPLPPPLVRPVALRPQALLNLIIRRTMKEIL